VASFVILVLLMKGGGERLPAPSCVRASFRSGMACEEARDIVASVGGKSMTHKSAMLCKLEPSHWTRNI
jgi:hypothetical protein